MGGGASTPALAAAVSEAGGLGFLAAGYKPADAVRADVGAVRAVTARPFGVNLFAPPQPVPDAAAVERYARVLERHGATGTARHDDDGWEEKLALVAELAVPVVSFAFGCPDGATVERLHAAGIRGLDHGDGARRGARGRGGGRGRARRPGRGGRRPPRDVRRQRAGRPRPAGALQLVAAASTLPLVATGGLATGRSVAAVLAAGAAAAQLGTAFMLAPEAATAPAHREAVAGDAPTGLTRAFTGRTARGIVNAFQRAHTGEAPLGYPDVHHVTAPLRAAARERGDADGFHLWAGQAHALAGRCPPPSWCARLAAEARAALTAARRWWWSSTASIWCWPYEPVNTGPAALTSSPRWGRRRGRSARPTSTTLTPGAVTSPPART